ncbi:hypothetical protein BDV18DRAFT_83725 [Aspergillus unguis]
MVEASMFIKTEPDEHNSDQNVFMMSQSGYSMHNQFGNANDGIDPSDLTNGGFMGGFGFGSQQNMSSSFNFGNSGIDTDELLDLEIQGQNGIQQNYMPDHPSSAGIAMSHPSAMSQMYSNTPNDNPIHSPFMQSSYNYDHLRGVNQGQLGSSHIQSAGSHFEQSYLNSKARPTMQAMDRASMDARSPMTPKTPAVGGLALGTPESGSFPTQPIRTGLQHRHQKTLSNQWDGTPGSAQSYAESPISSPGHPSHHAAISEILKSGKHASLPAKVDAHLPGGGDLESQEAKRRRRRASHNLVERRRRDNINERIQDLSHLVPQHRLEDDKVRKQLVNNTGMPGAGGPNAATSLLAGGQGRRAAGNITMGLPIEEKEKGPNKGDILNGAVGWTRDLMWALHVKIQQEAELAELISSLGGQWPFEQTEEEKRMRTEILDAIEKNDPSSFHYSRAPGTGLRVPKHTNIAGDAMSNGALSPQSLSPPFTGSNNGQTQYWNTSGHAGMSFKEEDEYAMEMN